MIGVVIGWIFAVSKSTIRFPIAPRFSGSRRRLISAAPLAIAGPALTASALTSGTAIAQEAWPTKPLRMVIGYAAGAGIDSAARQLAHDIEKYSGQPVVVDNRPGALGNIGAQQVAAAVGDPYTVLFAPNSSHATNVHLFRKLPFDPVKDFTPVSSFVTLGFVLISNPETLPVTSLAQLTELLKREPGKYNYGSGNATGMVAGELYKNMAGVDLTNVPYKSVPQAVTDLLGGRIHLIFADATLAIPLIKAGKVRALGVTSAQRIAALPEAPTLAQAGLTGYDISAWFALFFPANVPAPVVEKLSGYIHRSVQEPQTIAFLRAIGCEPSPSSPAELAQRVTDDTARWGKLIRMAGIQPE